MPWISTFPSTIKYEFGANLKVVPLFIFKVPLIKIGSKIFHVPCFELKLFLLFFIIKLG